MLSVDDALEKSTPVGRKMDQTPASFPEPAPFFNRLLRIESILGHPLGDRARTLGLLFFDAHHSLPQWRLRLVPRDVRTSPALAGR
jgi:hypothetical protein